jgi:hypothetical protein
MTSLDVSDLAAMLGLVPGVGAAIVNEPDGWLDALSLSDDVTLYERASRPLDVIVYFSDERANVERRLPVFAGFLAPGGALWMATPRSAGDLSRSDVEAIGEQAGLRAAGEQAVAPGWKAVRLEVARS